MEDFDPSAVVIAYRTLADLDEGQMKAVEEYCIGASASWEEAKNLIMQSWKAQEALRDLLKRKLSEDVGSYAVQGLIGGCASQFSTAYDMTVRRIRALDEMLEAVRKNRDEQTERYPDRAGAVRHVRRACGDQMDRDVPPRVRGGAREVQYPRIQVP